MAKLPKNFRITKDGKVAKTVRKITVSERMRQKNSKRVKVARGVVK